MKIHDWEGEGNFSIIMRFIVRNFDREFGINARNRFKVYNLIQLIEHSIEKMSKIGESQIYEDSQSDNDLRSDPSIRRKKKIKKQHKKKKSRALARPAHDQVSSIQQFFTQHGSLFNTSRSVLTEQYRQAVASSYHVRQLLSKCDEPVFDTKQTDCQQETWRYVALLRAIQLSTYQKLGIVGRAGAFAVGLLRPEGDPAKPLTAREARFLSSGEDLLVQRRAVVREQVQDYVQRTAVEMGYNQIQINDPDLEILTLAKINNQLEYEIMGKISRALAREDVVGNCQFEQQTSDLQNQYMRALIIKNLEKACTETPIDFLNYHKRIESYENNGYVETEFGQIQDLSTFRKYMGWKKPKHNKSSKYILRTPCSACLSDFSELSNPILKCPECPIRIHRHCQKVDNRCHRCRFGRTSNAEKSKTGFCYICRREREKGLMILTVTNRSPHYFAHNFCLLVHSLWRVEDGEFKGHHLPPPENPTPCTVCNEQGGIMLACAHCRRQVHAMCAYLTGASFRMMRTPDGPTPYKMEMSCCEESALRTRLSLQRKFKLNFEKVIFREDREIYEYITRSLMPEE